LPVITLSRAMGLFEVAMGLVVACVVAFQIWLTRRVFRSTMFERKQKIWQAQLIWLLPIIGATLVFAVLQEERDQGGGPSSHLKG
jgi:putative copper export protein